jgi:2-polyprenyl-3-methyl-5-hydroxy-6-metoxy-1,4-benzoquinol methylase
MTHTEACTDVVAYHGQLAKDWELRYRKRSFLARLAVLEKCLQDAEIAGRWLDAGCGSGILSRWLRSLGCEVVGVDASPEMVAVSLNLAGEQAQSGQLSFRQIETIARLPYGSETFDGILCSSVLEYLPDPEACLLEFSRVLKPEKLLLISVPNAASVVRKGQLVCHRVGRTLGQNWMKFLEFSHHQYRAAEFARLLAAAGFSVRKVVAFGSPLPVWVQRRNWGGSLLMFLAEKNAAGSSER